VGGREDFCAAPDGVVSRPRFRPARSRVRLAVVRLVIASLLFTLLGRLAWVQLVDAEASEVAAADARLRTVLTPAVRGTVLDRDGLPLAANRSALVISVDPLALADQPDGGTAVLERLATVLGVTVDEVRARITACGAPGAARPPVCYAGSPVQPAPVAEDVDPAVALLVAERPEDFPGVTAEGTAVRAYPAPGGVGAAHLLGYLSPVTAEELDANESAPGAVALAGTDLVGRSGLEQEYDVDLRGTPGSRTVQVDARGAVVAEVGRTAPSAGDNLVTSIDADIQAVTERALAGAIDRARTLTDPDGHPYVADGGSAVVLDVTDGSVVALASAPTYDPGIWVGGIASSEYAKLTAAEGGVPLLSRPIQGAYAPASTFKAITTSAALEQGLGTGPYACTSGVAIGDRTFRNYESRAYGPISLARALEVSCDTVFYRIAYDLWLRDGGTSPVAAPTDAITSMAHAFGLGRPTGIDLPGEVSGQVADRAWKQATWETTREETCARATSGYPDVAATDPARAAFLLALAKENCEDGWRLRAGDAVNTAIGQGDTLVTPVQMAVAYGAVANGGTLWEPRIGQSIVDQDGQVVREIPAAEAGRLPVSASTLAYLRTALQGVSRSGTGAGAFAGFPLDRIPIGAKTGSGEVFGKQSTSWFVAFSDRYAVVLTVSQGGTGSGTSGPGVRAIFDALYAENR
jgi:penicillin-binding protein 2